MQTYGGLLLFSLIQSLGVPGGVLPKIDAWWSLRLGGKLALCDAARIAYEAARKNKTLWAEAAERLGVDNSPTGILDYVATYFGMHVPIAIHSHAQIYPVHEPAEHASRYSIHEQDNRIH